MLNKQLIINLLCLIFSFSFGKINAQNDLKTMTIAPLPYLVSGKIAPDHIDHIMAHIMTGLQHNSHFTLVNINDKNIKGKQAANTQEMEDLGQKFGATHLFQIDFLGSDIARSTSNNADQTGQPVLIGTVKGMISANIRIYDVATGVLYHSILVKGNGQIQQHLPPGAATIFNNNGGAQGLHRKVMNRAVTDLVNNWKRTLRRDFPMDMRVVEFAKGNARKVKKLYINVGTEAEFARYEMLNAFIIKSYHVGGKTQIREVPLGTMRVSKVEDNRTLCVVYQGRDKIKFHFDKGDVIRVKVQ